MYMQLFNCPVLFSETFVARWLSVSAHVVRTVDRSRQTRTVSFITSSQSHCWLTIRKFIAQENASHSLAADMSLWCSFTNHTNHDRNVVCLNNVIHSLCMTCGRNIRGVPTLKIKHHCSVVSVVHKKQKSCLISHLETCGQIVLSKEHIVKMAPYLYISVITLTYTHYIQSTCLRGVCRLQMSPAPANLLHSTLPCISYIKWTFTNSQPSQWTSVYLKDQYMLLQSC